VLAGWDACVAAVPPSADFILSEDGYTARRGDGCFQGVMLGSDPLERQAGGLYFEVRISGASDLDATIGGLAIGVTHTAPEELVEAPGKAEDIPLTFAVGYAGSVYLNGCERQVSWNPEHLQISQRVGLLITDDGRGDLVIFEDSKAVVRISGVALRDGGLLAGPLYPLVDLFGATSSVTLVPRASPPSQRWNHLKPVELELSDPLPEPIVSDLSKPSSRAVSADSRLPPAPDHAAINTSY